MSKTIPTIIAPALAVGAYGKDAVHSRRSLDEQRGQTKPKAEPEVTTAKVKKAIKKAAPKAVAPKFHQRRSKPLPSNRPNRLILKQNREVRGLLTKAATAAGGTRLTPIGFASYTEFLAGVPLNEAGGAVVIFIPVKGNAPIAGKNVKLTIKGGKVVSVK